jgi:glycosyltransferase involved in cell wall biosynthesis
MHGFSIANDGTGPLATNNQPPSSGLHQTSSVLAIVPHYKCEPWLSDCLDSLVRQTHPLDGIVVIDDGSGAPPTDIVRQFPAVTLLASSENVGPYRLTQTVIEQTTYDAYLLQDADDWSAPERLALLLAAAARLGAELVGCQGWRVLDEEGEVVPLTYPLDVNAALEEWPMRYALLHPSSLVARGLVTRLGGYATGLRFGGDLEFLHRAAYAARVVNIPQFVYYKRIRPGALTSRPDTGLASPARQALRQIENARAHANAVRAAAGEPPDLRPMATADPIPLQDLSGPSLRPATSGFAPDVPERDGQNVASGYAPAAC